MNWASYSVGITQGYVALFFRSSKDVLIVFVKVSDGWAIPKAG